MPGLLSRCVALVALLAVATPAQARTLVVDAAGSGDFTDLPPAEAAAAHGDLLVVLAGIYSPFTTSKGITVLGQGTVRIRSSMWVFDGLVEVTALPAGRTFSMRNITVEHGALSIGINLTDNDGRIHLHDVRALAMPIVNLQTGSALRATACREVTVNASTFLGHNGIDATDTNLLVSSSSVAGANGVIIGASVMPAAAGLTISGGSVSLSRTDVRGGDGDTYNVSTPPREAIVATNGALILTGDTSTSVQAGVLAGSPPLPAIVTDGGSLDFDPSIAITGAQGGPPIAGSTTVISRRIVSLSADGGRLGGPVTAEIVSPAGDPLAMVLSLPVDPLPTTLGTVYFDPLLAIGLVSGARQNADERFAVSFRFPNLRSLRGVPFVLQAANFYVAAGSLELSNPVVLVLDD